MLLCRIKVGLIESSVFLVVNLGLRWVGNVIVMIKGFD